MNCAPSSSVFLNAPATKIARTIKEPGAKLARVIQAKAAKERGRLAEAKLWGL